MEVNSLCVIVFLFYRRYVTILDVIEKSIRKGKGAEQVDACYLFLHLIIQLGACSNAEEVSASCRNKNHIYRSISFCAYTISIIWDHKER